MFVVSKTVWVLVGWSRRRGSNPHGTKYHWILSPARLPVPPLRAFSYKHSTRFPLAQPSRRYSLFVFRISARFLNSSQRTAKLDHPKQFSLLPVFCSPARS